MSILWRKTGNDWRETRGFDGKSPPIFDLSGRRVAFSSMTEKNKSEEQIERHQRGIDRCSEEEDPICVCEAEPRWQEVEAEIASKEKERKNQVKKRTP